MRATALGLALATTFATTGGAWAMESPDMFLQAVNRNADRTISMREVDAYAMKRFRAINRDWKGDGTLSKSEVGERMTRKEFAAANTKHHGPYPSLSRAEFKAYVNKLFVAANVSVRRGHKAADGTLSRKELTTPAGRKLIRLLE